MAETQFNQHTFTIQIVSYSGFCVNEDIGDLCDNAVELTEEWRGITVDKVRWFPSAKNLHFSVRVLPSSAHCNMFLPENHRVSEMISIMLGYCVYNN